ncbi:MAG: Gfo/Idh/MocA family oxidoreductase [Paludisphaera borealis]|uniref:Gfo/Idh/MocA family protein n=1 Tax=Paludisphaera borealis TaxID=1387353 RepID=UPI0028427D6B|nr:Gfo/Idh/MocA family oxidoreductase [Paludisphaera borealis]MDR3622534.1 Gfo/Idh/MocA family oxidoreductase [Paludisphaera borealis]
MSSRRGFLGTMIGGAAGAAMTGAAMTATAGAKGRVRGANDRIRFGLIGGGSRGKEILRAAIQCPNVEPAAVADVYTRRLDEAKAIAPGATTYRDYRALLDDKTIDAVLIATPQHLHALHFVAAIQAGKDVYQEKTMAFNPNHARRMRNALEGTGRVVQVGMQMNSGDGVRKVREHVTAKDLGDITLVQTHHFRNAAYGGWLRDVPPDCNLEHVDWAAFQGEAKAVPFDPQRYINWRFFWDYSGGNVFENMVHTLAFWFGALNLSIPDSVTMTGANYLSPKMNIPDTFQVSMSHPEKLLFTFTSMFGNGYYGEGRDFLFGNKGTLSYSHSNGNLEVITKGAKPDESKPSAGYKDFTGLHMQNFFDCVRSRSEPAVPFELGFRTSIACRMAIDSFRRGTTVRWDPTTEEII